MAWADDWTAAGYALKSADVLALYNALRERGDVLLDYPFYSGYRVNDIAIQYPLGVDQYHTPFDVAHPEYIPAHLQAFSLWNNMKCAVTDMIGTLNLPNLIAAFDKDNDLDGKPFIIGDFDTSHGAGVSFFSPHLTGGGPPDFDPIGKIRSRAGLPLNYGRTIDNDGWRRRCPRFVLAGALGVPQDRDGNAAADGQRAWEITDDLAFLPTRANGDTPTGRLMQYNGAAGQWQYRGQAAGEMPDMLDSVSAPPNNTAPGSYGSAIYHGDYLDTVSTNELKQVLKKLVAWGWYVSWGDTENQSGSDVNNTSYTLAKSNATANYGAAAVTAGSGGVPFQFAEGQFTAGSGTPYSAYLSSTRSKMQAPFNNRLARAIKWYAGGSLYNEAGGGAGTENVFDAAGLAYVGDHVWKLCYAQAASTAADIPHGAGIAPDMLTPFIGQLTPTPAFPGFPFAGNPDRFAGWEIHYGIAVADYSGAFAYT